MNAIKRFLRNRLGVVSFGFLIVTAGLAILAPQVTHYAYDEQDIEHRLELPNSDHWMGTDTLGRDLYSRIIYGARTSLIVGLVTTLLALAIGSVTGALAGYRGGWTDRILMRAVDLFYIFPSLLIAILLQLIFGRGLTGIVIALSLTAWVNHARLTRAMVLQAREMNYVESARAIGATEARILWRHILPNLWGPLIVSLTIQIPVNIMAESFLSFIGLGLQPPFSSWGTLASEGFRAMKSYPHLILFPGMTLFLTLAAFNYLGDGLRDMADPRRLD